MDRTKPSPMLYRESFRQYDRLLRGEIPVSEYVRVLKAEVRESMRDGGKRRRRPAAA